MIALLQRVSQAKVDVDGERVGQIGAGLMVLVCAEPADTPATANLLLDRLINYRVFGDASGRMNRSLLDLQNAAEAGANYADQAGLLLVPQFTLAADTSSGRRPGFTGAAEPALARQLFETFAATAAGLVHGTQTGRFGADMQVSLTNDGPVTFWLQVPRQSGSTTK
ncbi:MAG: D-aminoacyl-tRNA deacylase [Burkholderiaceae bacterium]